VIGGTSRRGVLATQALGEFLSVVRRRRPDLVPASRDGIRRLRETFTTVETTLDLLLAAARLNARHQVPFRDAVIWKAGASAGGTILVMEDLQDGFAAGGVRVPDPFKPSNAGELNRLLPP
jgi:predicted nucleic acid-binding protein